MADNTSSKHAYLIMAHHNIDQLNLLLYALDYKDNDIYLHIDAKSTSIDTGMLYRPKYSEMILLDRLEIRWGTFSQIQAELSLFKAAGKMRYHYYHLMSGDDLPLKDQKTIHDFFDRTEINYIESTPDNDGIRAGRIRYYHPDLHRENRFLFGVLRRADRISAGIQKLAGVDRIRRLNIHTFYGANWCSLTHGCVENLLSKEDWINEHFQHSLCADEVYKQTVIANFFPDTVLSDGIPDRKYFLMRDIDWERGAPYSWKMNDYQELIDGPFMFARKFDQSEIELSKKIISFIATK